MSKVDFTDPLLGGADDREGLVAVEHLEGRGSSGDQMQLFFREGERLLISRERFSPFILLTDRSLLDGFEGQVDVQPLEGRNVLCWKAIFQTWKSCLKAKQALGRSTGVSAGAPTAPYVFFNDPVHQHLVNTGLTFFKGMRFDQLRRVQIDIECLTAPGYDFCNADRSEDRIVAIALCDPDGNVEVLGAGTIDEAEIIRRLVDRVRHHDPDIIEGHNIFNFDLSYIAKRARIHGIELAMGREMKMPDVRSSRLMIGDRTLSYTRYDFFGRHVLDTYFLVQLYDLSYRVLESYGLKDVARHFGLTPPDRTYVDGHDISSVFHKDPDLLMRYVSDDVRETRALSDLLSPVFFAQAQFLPFTFQNICVRGNAVKIDALMVRDYLRRNASLPMPEPARPFAGGYTDIFATGVFRNVHHVDVRSLYPSLMITRKIEPRTDEHHVFLAALEQLRAFRLDTQEKMRDAQGVETTYLGALQTTFKILINSFYGYLGFSQARFNDYTAAEKVTAEGRALLSEMVDWLNAHGARPVEIDTDGIYFMPPGFPDAKARDRFHEAFRRSLPEGIEVEFDGEYPSMFSYRMKNYALLTSDGEIVIKGAALKSRGLEPFQRNFLKELIRYRLEGRDTEIEALHHRYARSIMEGEWAIQSLAKTETLQDSPSTYEAKRKQGGRGRNAAYELVLRSGREYRAGDQVAYYVTGTKADVPVHSHARLVSEWNPAVRDENRTYYLAKLQSLYEKFIAAEGESGGEDNSSAARADETGD